MADDDRGVAPAAEPPGSAADPPAVVAAPVVAGVAHDLKNLLTAITQSCELALAAGGAPDGSAASFAAIQATAARAARLAADLMRLALGAPALPPPPLDVAAALEGLRAPLQAMVGPSIVLAIEAAACAGARVRIDAGAFDRLLVNLAANARDAMPAGGRLAIAAGLQDGGRAVGIAVTDSGCGIADAVRGRLFEAGVTTRAAGGRGQGLAIVRAIVEGAGGRVWAESAPEGGARFVVVLPVACEAAPADAAVPVAAAASAGIAGAPAAAILLVEDDAAVRALAARALTGKGYRVIAAASGEDALAAVYGDAAGIDLLITDVLLPGIDGAALAAESRRHRPGLPVVLVSGFTAEHAGAAPAGTRFLEKPYTLAELAAAAADALAGR